MKRPGYFQLLYHTSAAALFVFLVYDWKTDRLGFEPIIEATHRTGSYALYFLFASLSCTPVNILTGWTKPLQFRRALGLYSFFFAVIHALIFFVIDFGLDVDFLIDGFVKKPYALAGFAALLLMIPAAVTSTKNSMRKLKKNWKRIHRLVYGTAAFVLIHFIWLVKSDVREPFVWAVFYIFLMVVRQPRIRKWIENKRAQS